MWGLRASRSGLPRRKNHRAGPAWAIRAIIIAPALAITLAGRPAASHYPVPPKPENSVYAVQTHLRLKRVTPGALPRVPAQTASQNSGTEIIEWSGVLIASLTFLVAILTLGTAVVGFYGFSELRRARERAAATQRQMADRLREIEGLAGRWESAIQEANERVEAIVQSAYGFNQGQEAYAEGNYQRAVDCFRRASQLQPSNAAILYKLGRSYTNIGELEKAEAAFHDLLQVEPPGGEAYRGIAIAYRYDDLPKALINARLAVEADQADLKNWNCLGLLLRDEGKSEDAIAAHKRAYRLDETQRITSFYLALLYADTKRTASAGEYIHEATRHLEDDQHYGRIKPLWAAVLNWAYAIFDSDEVGAAEWARKAAAACQSLRRVHEVRGHMLFLLTALGRTGLIEHLPDTLRSPVPHPHPGERYDHGKDAAGPHRGRSSASSMTRTEE